ncbi:MAG: hypothetical protein WA374_01350 [Acidobacteriaceae bacterium]
MNRTAIRSASLVSAVALVVLLACPAFAQQTASVTDADGIPTVAAQMHLITTRIDLTRHQQVQVRPILQRLHTTTVAAVHDTDASPQERFDKIRDARLATDHQLRAVLTDDQQKQLDQLEHEPHPEMHGAIVSVASLPQP